jgi:signal transduction histidine kinase
LQIHPVTDGTIWLATNAGLVHFDPASGVTRTFTRDDGLPNNSLVGLIEDDVGYLWMATRSGGISRFDPKEEVFLNFDGRDGLGDLSFFSAIKDRSGNLYFYGLNGISEYVGGQRVTNPTPPEVRITGLTAKDQPISLTAIQGMQRVRLGHDQNDLTIHFQGFHYDNPNRNQHRVRLDPLDASWIDPGMERQVRYTNLDPGAYTFRVRAANSDGVWSEQEAELSIIIMPPLWRTWWAYVLYGLIFVLCIFAVSRIQRRRLIRKERERTRERELAQAREIERAYTKLKATQAQLIQQEKLASLGQLTAGIAHEIKNPLNFVNNLAEVNEELAQELRQGLTNGDNLDEIIDSIEQNSHVIKQHGKRADGIIRTMMHHARGGSGEWESTDINKLVYEYIDLAFHGKRVQVPNFNVKIEQYLDKNTGAAEIIPQEIGRVLLNLLGNAMDAVQERFVKEDADYTPIVKIVTERRDNRVLIEISDNGVGIPNANLEKIFEPFFTTKQSGTGTGLGLSLSYDIITQGHGGTLTVESMEGKGATFSMLLPVSKLSN